MEEDKKNFFYLALNCLRCLLSSIHHQLICFFYVTRAFVWHCRFPIEENCRIILNLLCTVSIASNGYIYVRIIFKTEKNKLKASCFCSVSGAFIERLSFLMSVTRTKVDLTSPCFRPNYQLNFSSLHANR